MRGAGEALVPMLSSLLSFWLVRVPGAHLFARYLGLDAMHFNSLAGWLAALAITVPYFLSGKWRGKIITQARAGYM